MHNNDNYSGLTSQQVSESRKLNGSNIIRLKEDNVLLQVFKNVLLEPMFILLVLVAMLYFLLARYQDGVIMLTALIFVAGISFYQNFRSRKAIKALNKFHSSNPTVIRENIRLKILPEEVVKGDIMIIEEGEIIAADGIILSSNDLTLDESILTGESFPVMKSEISKEIVYKNTLVNSGSGIIEVTAVGHQTRVGGIGKLMKSVEVEKTSLQLQINSFLRNMIWFGVIAFLLVVTFKFIQSSDIIQSALQGLTMAMSVLPEEIAVAFSTFLALGAYRLIKENIIVRHPQYVESLGAATVICLDKTGTITENSMHIDYLYDARQQISIPVRNNEKLPEQLLEYAIWSSEVNPFDTMEIAIHALYDKTVQTDKRPLYKQIHEYPLSGNPPMMTHIFMNNEGEKIIAAKGAPEAILRLSNLNKDLFTLYSQQALNYAAQGFRVLAIGKGSGQEPWPASQQGFQLEFLGLIAFQDPPKKNITAVLQAFDEAGIVVKLVTGDYAETASAIARQVNLKNSSQVITGREVMQMTEQELQLKAEEVNIFARMYPEAKLKLIDALKLNGEVVAMTGDGVNDAPALKSAHIGIAMGKKGSEVAKKAASLIISDDELGHMVQAIALGRKIYDNLKKAIRYIVSIHIPIIMIVSLPVLLYWKFSEIFTPVHVIFLELIMGPTCSIIYENEPIEPGTMKRKPLKIKWGLLLPSQLMLSIIQGIIAGAVCLSLGYYHMQSGGSETNVRTIVFLTLLLCNIFLTLENRSSEYSIVNTLSYKNWMMYAIMFINILFIIAIMLLPSVREIFKLELLSPGTIAGCLLAAFLSITWIELWKFFVRRNAENKKHHKVI